MRSKFNLLPLLGAMVFGNAAVADESKTVSELRSERDASSLQAKQEWEHTLPFFAETAIYNGYDLPLPFGISFVYTNVKQNMTLEDLEVGFDGSRKIPIDFVPFEESSVNNHSPQIKFDAWVLPFFNVYATVGKLTGTADIAFTIDGGMALDQAGIECDDVKLKYRAVCNVVDNNAVPFDFEASLSGYTYTAGFMFTYGVGDYFIAVPASFSWTDMDRSETDGQVINVLPRVGRQFNLPYNSTLAAYAGASFLKSKLTLSGTQPLPTPEGETFDVDYKIQQENTEQWAGLVGANYSFNKIWMLSVEYTGIGTEDRKQFITNLSYRY